jgi:hypothetical protein
VSDRDDRIFAGMASDRDGAHFLMGCRPWDAISEGQEGGVPPEPGRDSGLPPHLCFRCGSDPLSDRRQTCASCMTRLDDAELRYQRAKADAREKAARHIAARFRPRGKVEAEPSPSPRP